MTVRSDDQLLPISGLQHLVFCERQCALIHVERVWSENSLTAEGQLLHRRTDDGGQESRNGIRIVRSIELISHELGLIGKSDVVEFRAPPGISPSSGLDRALSQPSKPQLDGWVITPIEYKRGRPKTNRIWGDCDRVQVCAQALCLEEMLSVSISSAVLFYGEQKRRLEVDLTQELREKTRNASVRFHELVRETKLPTAVNDRRCKRCSLKELCMPQQTASKGTAGRWIANQLKNMLEAGN
jgi:CRISPR-associated exonuclease Cas4